MKSSPLLVPGSTFDLHWQGSIVIGIEWYRFTFTWGMRCKCNCSVDGKLMVFCRRETDLSEKGWMGMDGWLFDMINCFFFWEDQIPILIQMVPYLWIFLFVNLSTNIVMSNIARSIVKNLVIKSPVNANTSPWTRIWAILSKILLSYRRLLSWENVGLFFWIWGFFFL